MFHPAPVARIPKLDSFLESKEFEGIVIDSFHELEHLLSQNYDWVPSTSHFQFSGAAGVDVVEGRGDFRLLRH